MQLQFVFDRNLYFAERLSGIEEAAMMRQHCSTTKLFSSLFSLNEVLFNKNKIYIFSF